MCCSTPYTTCCEYNAYVSWCQSGFHCNCRPNALQQLSSSCAQAKQSRFNHSTKHTECASAACALLTSFYSDNIHAPYSTQSKEIKFIECLQYVQKWPETIRKMWSSHTFTHTCTQTLGLWTRTISCYLYSVKIIATHWKCIFCSKYIYATNHQAYYVRVHGLLMMARMHFKYEISFEFHINKYQILYSVAHCYGNMSIYLLRL